MRLPHIRACVLGLGILGSLGLSVDAHAQWSRVCVRDVCSNDPDNAGDAQHFGDEVFVWQQLFAWHWKACPADRDTPCTTDQNRRCFEVARYPSYEIVGRRCEVTTWSDDLSTWIYEPPPPRFCPYAVDAAQFPWVGETVWYVVRSCTGGSCSDWSPRRSDGSQDYVEFVGVDYACLGSRAGRRCEEECYPGAPKRFAAIPDCMP